MSLETALESYPKQTSTKSGLKITLRPLVATDAKALAEFFRALPQEELMFLKERLNDPAVLKQWCKRLDYHQNLPLLAWNDKHLVGVVILHQEQGGWKRHIGHLNVYVHPKQRGQGIGRLLIAEIIDLARRAGLERLEAEFFGAQENAIKLFGLMGFSNLLSLPEYVKDMQANAHDYIMMGIKLSTEEEYAGMG